MKWIGIIQRRVRALVQRTAVEQDMDDELRLHFELAIAEAKRRGLSDTEAVAAARFAFGGMDQTREAYRDARGVSWAEDAVRDLRYAVHDTEHRGRGADA
jgi:hypothetical protein